MGVKSYFFNNARVVCNELIEQTRTSATHRLLLVFIITLFTSSQVFAFSGKVVDSEGSPIVGATIATNISSVGTITDENGSFKLKKQQGITYITVSSIGFKSVNFDISEIPQEIQLKQKYYKTNDILVTSDRAELGITPIAFDNISADEIKRDYSVGELPLLLKNTPNLHSFSDGGASLGYSYIRIRGFDDKRIVTYINGVPLNDPEDHATYFVDLPDFPSNVTDIQVQRGVGNSLYGDASFGGTINIVTTAFNTEQKTSLSAGYGGYKDAGNIYKQSLSFSSGLVDGKWAYNGRFSKQKSGGYKHNSWYNGWAYYFSLGRIDPKMTTEFYVYGGPMQMHLAYYGAPRDEIAKDRKYNPLTYSNETDNFNQPHYQLQNVYKINEHTTLSNTFYYIRGKGYYEQLKKNRTYTDYNLENFSDSSTGDLVRQQWVHKSQYGWNPRLDIEHAKGKYTIGGSFYSFDSDHWGQVVWAEYLNSSTNPQQKYYQYFGKKQVGSFFVQEYYKFTEKLSTQITAQLRYQKYKLNSEIIGAFAGYGYDLDWLFFSPRIGFNYIINSAFNLFANFSVASRAPSDIAIYDANDPEIVPSLDANGNPTAKSERVYDFELGMNYLNRKYSFGANLFYMTFDNEIIPYGGINESGISYTTNVNKSLHSGIELTGAIQPIDNFTVSGNYSYNYNIIKDFKTDIGLPVDYKDKTIPYFPEYLGNIVLDHKTDNIRLTYTHRFVGKQYMELLNLKEYAISSYTTGSIALSYTIFDFLSHNNLTVQFRVDNIFDKKYEVSGYGGNFAIYDNVNVVDVYGGWAEYYVAPGRSMYGQIKMELF